MKALSLALPFYNEEANVNRVVDEMIQVYDAKGIDYELILIDNGSWDKTPFLLSEYEKKYPLKVKVVTVSKNEGYGWGILQGLKVAGGAYVGYTPGDGQVPAADIANVYQKAKELNLDFCQGKRVRKDVFLRKMNTHVYNFIFHIFFPSNVRDVGSNPKIMRKEWYEKLGLVSKDWFIDSEIISKTYLMRGKMEELPVAFNKRGKGKSKINLLSVAEMIRNLIVWRFKTLGWTQNRETDSNTRKK